MSEQDDNFLSRWSRRKVQVRQGVQPPPAAAPAAVVPFPGPAVNAAVAPGQARDAADDAEPPRGLAAGTVAANPAQVPAQAVAPVPAPPQPTLHDVEALTPESDFSRFIARDVDEKVKNSAMKKLFSDPHYNVMDGLDTYIADYNTPDPLPKAMLRQLVQARMLGLLDDELPEQPVPGAVTPGAVTPAGAAASEEGQAGMESEVAPKDEPEAAAEDPTEMALPAPEDADGALTVAAVPDVLPAAPDEPAHLKAPQPVGGSSSSAS